MATWSITRSGSTLTLDGSPFKLISIDGIGAGPIRRLTERGPLQDGETDIGYRLDPRMINLVLWILGTSQSDCDTHRDTLQSYLHPGVTASLQCTRDDSEVRQIDCRVLGMVDTPGAIRERTHTAQRVGVQLYAADPTWYDPTLQRATVVTGSDSTGLTIPLIVDVDISGETINAVRTVTYPGTSKTYPTITITGPIDDLEITNLATGDELQFDTSISDGDTITVDLSYGNKTIVDQAGTNRISYLSNDSDLATWSIEPAPVVTDGTNSLRITGTGADAGSTVLIEYYERYIGV